MYSIDYTATVLLGLIWCFVPTKHETNSSALNTQKHGNRVFSLQCRWWFGAPVTALSASSKLGLLYVGPVSTGMEWETVFGRLDHLSITPSHSGQLSLLPLAEMSTSHSWWCSAAGEQRQVWVKMATVTTTTSQRNTVGDTSNESANGGQKNGDGRKIQLSRLFNKH